MSNMGSKASKVVPTGSICDYLLYLLSPTSRSTYLLINHSRGVDSHCLEVLTTVATSMDVILLLLYTSFSVHMSYNQVLVVVWFNHGSTMAYLMISTIIPLSFQSLPAY